MLTHFVEQMFFEAPEVSLENRNIAICNMYEIYRSRQYNEQRPVILKGKLNLSRYMLFNLSDAACGFSKNYYYTSKYA